LDLAVTGEGFFPLRSGDGQDLFTRNGSFLLDEQNTVVNSAGQFLQVASVDSLGKADFQADLVPLTIAPTTVGQAIATSKLIWRLTFQQNHFHATHR
jgi:flagellar hook protein FlgE